MGEILIKGDIMFKTAKDIQLENKTRRELARRLKISGLSMCKACGNTEVEFINYKFIKGVANKKHYIVKCGKCEIKSNMGWRNSISKAIYDWNNMNGGVDC